MSFLYRIVSVFLFFLLASFGLIWPSQAQVKLEIGYMPILPVSQLFVNLESGDLAQAGIEPELVEFQNGPAIVQALLAGQLDIAYFGIGPAMVARAKGVPIKVIATNIKEQIGFIALPKLASYFDNGPAQTAFTRFAAEQGRKPVISTFPVGSVPQIVLEFWLRKQRKTDPDEITIIYQGAAQIQQSLLSGAIDGAAILEPAISLTLGKVKNAKLIASGSQMFPAHPGAVLAVNEEIIKKHPEILRKLVAFHKSATQELNTELEKVAPLVQKWVAGGRLPIGVIRQAILRSQGKFSDDPREIIAATSVMQDFQKELGSLKTDLDLAELFALDFYE